MTESTRTPSELIEQNKETIMQAHIIRSVNTNKLIEAHDDASKAHAERMVKVHNNLYPHNKWYLSTEML